jgi:hypothetical protein
MEFDHLVEEKGTVDSTKEKWFGYSGRGLVSGLLPVSHTCGPSNVPRVVPTRGEAQ